MDGYYVQKGFQHNLKDGLIDVPLYFGSMAEECNIDPDVDVSDYTKLEWSNYLEIWFLPWASGVGTNKYL